MAARRKTKMALGRVSLGFGEQRHLSPHPQAVAADIHGGEIREALACRSGGLSSWHRCCQGEHRFAVVGPKPRKPQTGNPLRSSDKEWGTQDACSRGNVCPCPAGVGTIRDPGERSDLLPQRLRVVEDEQGLWDETAPDSGHQGSAKQGTQAWGQNHPGSTSYSLG